MGLFSKDKYVTTVGTSGSPLMDRLPTPLKDAILGSIASNGTVGISESILRSNLAGFHADVKAFYNYGKNRFYRGLPEGTFTQGFLDHGKITKAVKDKFGEEAYVVETSYTLADAHHVALEYNALHYPDTDETVQDAFFSGTTITYLHMPSMEEITGTALNQANSTDDMYNITYKIQGDSKSLYWTYNPASNEYPEWLPLIGEREWGTPFYPVVPVRENKVMIDAGYWMDHAYDGTKIRNPNHTPSEKETQTKQILNKLGVGVHDITKALEENPDIANVDDAFVLMGLNIQTEYSDSRDYLMKFFKYLSLESDVSQEMYDAWANPPDDEEGNPVAPVGPPPSNEFNIREADLDVTIAYNFIGVVQHAGELDGYKRYECKSRTVINEALPTMYYTGNSYIEFTKQYDGYYEVVTVHGITHYSTVWDGEGVLKTLEDSIVKEGGEFTDFGFFIPVNREILQSYSGKMEAAIAGDALLLFVHSYTREYVKWYKRESFLKVFQVVVWIVAIVLAVFTAGQSITAAVAIEAAMTAVMIGLAVKIIVKVLAKVLPTDILIAISAVLAVVGMVYGVNVGMTEMLTAIDVVNAVSQIALGSIAESMALDTQAIYAEMNELSQEYDDWLSDWNEESESLERDSASGQAYAEAVRTQRHIPYEEPNTFFARSLLTNPGVLALDSCAQFVGNALSLPKDHNITV